MRGGPGVGDLEVGTSDPRLVGVVEHDAAVEEVGAGALDERGVLVEVRGAEGVLARGDGAVLAGKIANLARLGLGLVADRVFAALGRVKVSAGCAAVAVLGDGVDMDVVGCEQVSVTLPANKGDSMLEHTEGATLRQTAQLNVELDSNTAVAGLGNHLALDVASVGEAGLLPGVLGKDRFGNETNRVVRDSSSCRDLLRSDISIRRPFMSVSR